MAIVTQPGVATIFAADGKLSGPVMVHIRRTAGYRRAYPSKNLTENQKRSAAAFRYVDLRWKRKSQAERQLWDDWKSWRGGHGYNRFQWVNIPRRLAGLPLLLDPPQFYP